MTKFEKEFLLQCLDSITTIITNDEEINRVVLIFNQGDVRDPRFQMQSKITESADWPNEEKITLSAAVFDAIAHTSYKFCSNKSLAPHVEAAATLLRDHYLPLITQNTEPSMRLASVKQNISAMKSQINDAPLEAPKHYASDESNPNTFFKVVSVVGLGLATMATIALTR